MFAWQTLLVIATGFLAPSAAEPRVKLSSLSVPPLRSKPALTAEKKSHIIRLIAQLAEVDRPDVGYSPTYGGMAFLPVPGQIEGLSWTWTNHKLKSCKSLRELVALGPDALPFLLDALGDNTATKLTLIHGDPGDIIREGGMYFSDELPPGNELNISETKVPSTRVCRGKKVNDIDTYVVKVGDLCLVAVGQIVGRPYLAARYQMTAFTVINSPVEDAGLRDRVRKIWVSDDPTRTLYESLWTDYRTTGIPTGPDRIGWNWGSRFQRSAVLRLLYYFPNESAPVIVDRLNGLDVTKAKEGTVEFARRGVANGGIYADEFLPAVEWCKVPAVRQAVRGVFHRTTEAGVFAGTLDAFEKSESDVIVKKAGELLDGMTLEEGKEGVPAYILDVTSTHVGATAAPIFRRQIARSDPASLGSLAEVLGRAKGDWPVALLKPLLDDRRQTDRVYSVRSKDWKGPVPAPLRIGGDDDGYERITVRVCDAAAEALAKILPTTAGKFPAEPDQTTLDQYVSRLKQKLPSK